MTKVDDISVGDFVVVIKDLSHEPVGYREGFIPYTIPEPAYDGVPFEVVAIGLPFLVLKTPYDRASGIDYKTVDIRKYQLQKVDTSYVSIFINDTYTTKTGEVLVETEKSEKHRKVCPECGGSLCETRLLDTIDIATRSRGSYHSWAFKCDSCSFIGIKRK